MRIITGTAKGRKIHTPEGLHTRPALARVREAIFSSLGDITDKVVLDVFAGSGSLGLEALSRGAKKSYFIDSSPEAIKVIIQNLDHLNFSDRAQVFKRTLPVGLKNVRLEFMPHIIFCDPPYDKHLINQTISQLMDYKFIDHNSCLIIEHSPREVPQMSGLETVKQSKYGQTLISYMKTISP